MKSKGIVMRVLLYGVALAGYVGIGPAVAAVPKGEAAISNVSASESHRVQESYGKLPLSFEANEGQTDRSVQFLSRGQGYQLFLTSTEAVLALQTPMVRSGSEGRVAKSMELTKAAASSGQTEVPTQVVLRMQLVGANLQPEGRGEDVLPGKVNYFLGNDPAQWWSNVPTYGKVRYSDVYPGVDVVYYGNQRQLEFDFVVAPGADPTAIRLAFDGADKLTLEADDLVVRFQGGTIRLHQPAVWQDLNGIKQPVVGRYDLLPIRAGEGQERTGQVGFQVAAYDASHPLVIDPVLSYSTYLGGSSFDQPGGIAVDAAGNAYVTGQTTSSNFPVTAGVVQSTSGGDYDAFVAKLNPTGTALVYATYLGGSGLDNGAYITVDAIGNAYFTGLTKSSNFPVTAGAFQSTLGGGNDTYVAKLNSTGTALAYATYLGGSCHDEGPGNIVVDATGNAYVTGTTYCSDFPTTPGVVQPTNGGGDGDAFVTKLNPTGTALVYSTFLGGNGLESGSGVTIDAAGDAYVTGSSYSSNFPTTPGVVQPTNAGGTGDAFVTEVNPTGTALIYSTYLGGTGGEVGLDIALDAAGNAYVGGYSNSTDFPTTVGVVQPTSGGGLDAFVAKLNPTGTALLYATYVGGSGDETTGGFARDAAGNTYIAGWTTSSNFPTTPGTVQPTSGGGGYDAFVAKLNPSATAFGYGTYLGGSGNDLSGRVAVDAAGTAYVTGWSNSSNFPVTAGVVQPTLSGDYDGFVAKISVGHLVCSTAQANPDSLWTPKHQFVPIAILGITNPDNYPLTLTVLGVRQDETVTSLGSGSTSPDAIIQGGNASVRAERDGNGNGRVYHLAYKAEDGHGGACAGEVTVGVPHSQGKGVIAIDGGPLYDSTQP